MLSAVDQVLELRTRWSGAWEGMPDPARDQGRRGARPEARRSVRPTQRAGHEAHRDRQRQRETQAGQRADSHECECGSDAESHPQEQRPHPAHDRLPRPHGIEILREQVQTGERALSRTFVQRLGVEQSAPVEVGELVQRLRVEVEVAQLALDELQGGLRRAAPDPRCGDRPLEGQPCGDHRVMRIHHRGQPGAGVVECGTCLLRGQLLLRVLGVLGVRGGVRSASAQRPHPQRYPDHPCEEHRSGQAHEEVRDPSVAVVPHLLRRLQGWRLRRSRARPPARGALPLMPCPRSSVNGDLAAVGTCTQGHECEGTQHGAEHHDDHDAVVAVAGCPCAHRSRAASCRAHRVHVTVRRGDDHRPPPSIR